MLDQNGHHNRGWRLPKKREVEVQTKISNGSEYPKGDLLRKCAHCSKFVPYGNSFHFEECAGQ
jgi:hypothetical protein